MSYDGVISCVVITSPELGKQCIIGTTNAIHLVSDGDLLMVNCNEAAGFKSSDQFPELHFYFEKFPHFRQKNWYKVGYCEQPILRKEFYFTGLLPDNFKRYSGLDGGFLNQISINLADYDTGEEHNLFIKRLLLKLKVDPSCYKKMIDKIKGICKSNEALCERLLKAEINKSNVESYYREFKKAYIEMVPYSFLQYQNEKLSNELIKYSLTLSNASSSNFEEIKSKMQALPSSHKSYSYQAIEDIRSIAKKISKLKTFVFKGEDDLCQKVISNQLLKKAISEHIKKYGWLKIRNFLGEVMTQKEVVSDIYRSLQGLDDFEQRARDGQKQIFEYRLLLNELGLNKESINLLDIILYQIYFRTYRKEVMSKLEYSSHGIFYFLSQQMGIDYEDIFWLRLCELEKFIHDGVLPDISNIYHRKLGHAIILSQGELFLYDHRNMNKKRHSLDTINLTRELRGIPTCKGIVIGTAKVVLSYTDLEKVKEGDVFITDMTTMNYLSGLKKASAFITNRGGLLCHAAILSRELKKPCIIDTKQATEIFKDGDMVEVDASHGKVTIIKKA